MPGVGPERGKEGNRLVCASSSLRVVARSENFCSAQGERLADSTALKARPATC